MFVDVPSGERRRVRTTEEEARHTERRESLIFSSLNAKHAS